MQTEPAILKCEQIGKRFPGVRALDNVNFMVKKGEVQGLVGENGAGKSTLMKIILGTYKPTSGMMYLKGVPYTPRSPRDALENGISMIHQEISLVPTTSVSENIWIGREEQFSKNGMFINARRQARAAEQILDQLGLGISADTKVSRLSIAEMQLVEVARAISYDSDIIIMDEPTSALTNAEIEKLYGIIENLARKGKSIIFISHKLEEVLRICDSVTILRDGQFIMRSDIEEVDQEKLIRLMVGREMKNLFPKEIIDIKEPVLEVSNLTRSGYIRDVNFTVHRGEILGFSGLMGSRRTEIMQLLFGIDKVDSGTIRLNGEKIKIRSTGDAIKHKLSMVTEDRLHRGAFHMLSVLDNTTIAYLESVSNLGFINKKQEARDATDIADAMEVKRPSMDVDMALLSGGNQQKVIIAKWLLTEPDVLILDEPTRGIDVGAKSEIYKLIGKLAKQGKAILFVSSELPELIGICDRILVVREGQIVAEYLRHEFDQEKIMKSAFGVN